MAASAAPLWGPQVSPKHPSTTALLPVHPPAFIHGALLVAHHVMPQVLEATCYGSLDRHAFADKLIMACIMLQLRWTG